MQQRQVFADLPVPRRDRSIVSDRSRLLLVRPVLLIFVDLCRISTSYRGPASPPICDRLQPRKKRPKCALRKTYQGLSVLIFFQVRRGAFPPKEAFTLPASSSSITFFRGPHKERNNWPEETCNERRNSGNSPSRG